MRPFWSLTILLASLASSAWGVDLMKRTILGALCTAGLLLICSSASAQSEVAAGYDLYQLEFPFFPALDAPVDIPLANGELFPEPGRGEPIGFFDQFDVVSNPLGVFDFGSGLVDVGAADTIVRRDAAAIDPGDGSGVVVPIEIVALSLRSVQPVEVGGGQSDFLYVSLNPELPSIGQYEFFFSGLPGDFSVGDMSAEVTLNFQTRVGSPDGLVLDTGSVVLGTDFGFGSVPFSNFPEGLGPFNEPDKLIDGVNFLLNGNSQDSDFFQLGIPLVLQNFDDFNFYELAFEHANADEPGDSAENPFLPDDQDGLSFIFNDVPQEGWFDPPATNAYLYETDGNSNFVSVFTPGFALVPDADGQYLISSVHGDVTVFAGTGYTFPSPVESFIISGIDPSVDGGDPLAFPTFLSFDELSNTFTQTPVPEPASVVLCLIGLVAVGVIRKR